MWSSTSARPSSWLRDEIAATQRPQPSYGTERTALDNPRNYTAVVDVPHVDVVLPPVLVNGYR
jgi:hypothetical protein